MRTFTEWLDGLGDNISVEACLCRLRMLGIESSPDQDIRSEVTAVAECARHLLRLEFKRVEAVIRR